MPIGQRNPRNEPGTTGTGAPQITYGQQAPDAVPGGFAQQPLQPTWLRRQIRGALQTVEGASELMVAQLPAPGPGVSYVLERLVVGGGCDFLVCIGPNASIVGSVVEYVATTAATTTQSDPWPWRLGSQDSLFIIWVGSATSTQALTVQARVEPAA